MTDLTRHTGTDLGNGRHLDCDKVREHRRWVRFVIPDLVTRVSWNNGTQTVTHVVNLVNVSASGAAVIMDVKPPTDRPCTIFFEHGGVSSGPITAELVSMTVSEVGSILVKFMFDPVEETKQIIRTQRERRAWQRVSPTERRSRLSWFVGSDTVSVAGEVKNISGGGVAVQTDATPPQNEAIWFSLGPEGGEADPVECRLVGFHHDRAGMVIARLAFVDLCPLSLYHAAVGVQK